jgi:hypothetical protein
MTTWPEAVVVVAVLVCALIGWIAWLKWGQR